MKLKDKCISLELAQKIAKVAKEKGVELAESEKIYYPSLGEMLLIKTSCEKHRKFGLPAYDIAELGEMLPVDKGGRITISKVPSGVYLSGYFKENHKEIEDLEDKFLFLEDSKTEAEARGKMLLYLLENDLLK